VGVLAGEQGDYRRGRVIVGEFADRALIVGTKRMVFAVSERYGGPQPATG